MGTDKNTLCQKCRKFNGRQTQTYMGDRERERQTEGAERQCRKSELIKNSFEVVQDRDWMRNRKTDWSKCVLDWSI